MAAIPYGKTTTQATTPAQTAAAAGPWPVERPGWELRLGKSGSWYYRKPR